MIIFCQFEAFFIQFHLHLIGPKGSIQAGLFKGNLKTPNSARSIFGVICSTSLFNLESLCNSTWHVPWNPSKPRKLVPCRRLLQRRDPSTSRGRATGAAAARGPMAPSTEKTAHGASKKIKAVENPCRCCPRGAMEWPQPTQQIPRAIAS